MPGLGGWKEVMSVLRPKIQVDVSQAEPDREEAPGRGTHRRDPEKEKSPMWGAGRRGGDSRVVECLPLGTWV